MSFFSSVQVKYQDIKLPEIPTEQFLLATNEVIRLFDVLGSTAFAPVKNDMNGNIAKIRKRSSEDAQGKFLTLQGILDYEKTLPQKQRVGTEGLMWLLRGLTFTATALRRNLQNTSEELSQSFTKAYEETLSKFHTFLIRPVFALAMKACPYRNSFYKTLSGDDDEAASMKEVEPWLKGLEDCLKVLNDAYAKEGYGW